MRRKTFATKLVVIAALFVSPMLAGCDVLGVLGPNVNLNYVLPLGFGGAPGLYNPYGIVQAIVNSLLGTALPSGDSGDSGSPQPNPSAVNSTAVGAVSQ